MRKERESTYHTSVLVNEVLEYLDPQPGGVYLDVTFGGGGHTRAILESSPDVKIVALDWDQVALDTNGPQLEEDFPGRVTLIWGSFAHLHRLVKKHDIGKVDGILADFGTSQYQIAERPGFSFKEDRALDMRMSPAHQKITAADVLNTATERELSDIFFEYSEERHSRKIARAVVADRKKKPFKKTLQLAKLIERLVPSKGPRKIHPATRVFQALRIYVNRELDNIKAFLAEVPKVLKPGGRIVCISFHSLEDRLVKHFFKEHKEQFDILTPKVVKATPEELATNPSARSACLRAAMLRE